ncbi:MAG: hypothetical protein WA139_05960 [Candidatus Aenigmatarchaeota archaeon]
MADDNEWIAMNVENEYKNGVNKPWKAVSSPQIMVHNSRTVVYQQLEYHCGSGFYRGYVVVPGYATSAPYKKDYKEKVVTAFNFERINDESDRKEIEECLSDRDTTMPLPKGSINIAPRERTLQEKERDAIESERLEKEAKAAEENLLKAMQNNPNVREFVKGFAECLHKDVNRMQA